ncbi:TPA: hypothetical protein ACH3X1_005872 [Trebouxia sp. C0004]
MLFSSFLVSCMYQFAAVCLHLAKFASAQCIMSGHISSLLRCQNALYVEAAHEPDQNADTPRAAYQKLNCFTDCMLSHCFCESTQCRAYADVPFIAMHRPYTLCTWCLVPDSPEVLMVEDLQQDARFRDFELVTQPPYLRSYVGAPVVLADGHRVGVMCVLGTAPRATNAATTRLLVNVAGLVAREIEALARPDFEVPLASKAPRSRQQGLMMLDTSQPGWPILHSDCDDQRLHAQRTDGQLFWDMFAVADVAQPEVLFQGTAAKGAPFKIKAAIADPSGFADFDAAPFELEFRPGDAALPSRYIPMGTQVGTPAWIPESVEEQVDVANIWFVIIKHSSDQNAVSGAAAIGTPADKDADKHKGQAASSSECPAMVLGAPGIQGGWEDVQVGYLVGRGATGSVYRAICNGHQVAVKIISPEQDRYIKRTPDGTPMEVALTRGLSHPNIVRALRHASFNSQNASLAVLQDSEVGSMDSWDSLWDQEALEPPSSYSSRHNLEDNQETWLMLEYCDKGSLLDAVDRGWLYTRRASHFTGVTDLKKLLLTALELANALAYLHSVDVMHGDLTGGNVLLHSSPITPTDPRGFTVKVADFGMSRIQEDSKQTAGQGTLTHMPPELIRHAQLHRSADVWAFGILLWEMYSGRRAWLGLSYKQVMQAVGYEQRAPDWPADAPPELAAAARSCCNAEPDERPTFRQLLGQLTGMLSCSQSS